MSILRATAERISGSVGAADDFADTLLEQKDEVNRFLRACGNCDEPVPPNPNPSPTDEESKAWQDAHNLKVFAGKATAHHLKAMSHRIRKGRRKGGNPISQSEAESLANSIVSNACQQPLEEISAALLESRQG